MAKWADYLISGVWKDKDGRITDVMLHEDSENHFFKGKKTEVATVIGLIKSGKKIITITWNYPSRYSATSVKIVDEFGREYLRIISNETEKDTLDNSIRMEYFNV